MGDKNKKSFIAMILIIIIDIAWLIFCIVKSINNMDYAIYFCIGQLIMLPIGIIVTIALYDNKPNIT